MSALSASPSDDGNDIVYLTRREAFSAAHRLHSPHLSDEENREIYGKCNNPNGHGHNYVLEITVCGPLEPRTGMVMNLSELKAAIDEHVLRALDHRHLDRDVAYFNTRPSTTEHVARFVWQALAGALGGRLHEVRVRETDNNSVVYRGPPLLA